jgi:hypothetical protein
MPRFKDIYGSFSDRKRCRFTRPGEEAVKDEDVNEHANEVKEEVKGEGKNLHDDEDPLS